jgi:nitrite reductase/ring-hydroxylating ferredoxin subunit
MSRRRVIGEVDDFAGRTTRIVVEGRRIAIFDANGHFYALRDACPHQGASLGKGQVVCSLLASRPGVYRLDEDRPVVRCPHHGWEYELQTGRSVHNPERDRVKSYDVSVVEGDCLQAKGDGNEVLQAETFEIEIEGKYVVLHL